MHIFIYDFMYSYIIYYFNLSLMGINPNTILQLRYFRIINSINKWLAQHYHDIIDTAGWRSLISILYMTRLPMTWNTKYS